MPATTVGRTARRILANYGPILFALGAVVLVVVGIGLAIVGDSELTEAWLDTYGFAALFLVLVLEGAMLLYFAPSESLVPLGVALLADDPGGYVAVILTAVVGATIGQYALYLVARRGGRAYLLQKPWFRISEESLDRFDTWFGRWGRVVVPVSNALLFTRGMATVPAGLSEMGHREFVVLSALGTLVFQSWLALVALYGLQYLPELPG